MTVTLPPDLSVLRRLVRDELAPNDRHDVACWLVANADESVANALDALAVEARESTRDRGLSEDVARLSAAFCDAFEAGVADIDPAPRAGRPDLLRTSTLVRLARDELSVERFAPHPRRVRVRDGGTSKRVLYATNDLGEIHRLDSVTYDCEIPEGRVTFWWLVHEPAILATSEMLDAIREGLRTRSVRALRLTEEFFTG